MGTCRLLVASLAFAATAAEAQSPAPSAAGSWMLGVGGQVDEHGNDGLMGTINVGVARSTWLSFAAGRSTSPADRADIEADTLVLGFDHRFDRVGFTLEAERWGDSGVLETEDLAGSVYFANERWRLAFGYKTRDIEIPFTLTGPFGGTLVRTAEVGAESYAVNARVGLGERWQLYFGLADYDYERDLAVLPRIDALNLLSSSTLTLANSFLEQERSIGVERAIGRGLLTVGYTTDRSAVDGSELETFDVAALIPLGTRVDLEVNLGTGRSDFFDAGTYGGLLFLVYGR